MEDGYIIGTWWVETLLNSLLYRYGEFSGQGVSVPEVNGVFRLAGVSGQWDAQALMWD